MAYSRVSVLKDGPNPGRPTGKAGYIILFDWDDVETYTRDASNVTVSAFAFANGKTPIGVYATASTQNVFHQVAGGDDARGFIHHADFEVPGDSLAFNEFIENNVNGNLGAIFVPCAGNDCRIAGLPCNPLRVTQDNGQSNNEAVKHAVQLVQSYPGAALGHIAKSIVPLTDNATVNGILGLTGTGSEGGGI